MSFEISRQQEMEYDYEYFEKPKTRKNKKWEPPYKYHR
jgi:hypothetical protein